MNNENEITLDYEGMYKQLSLKKRDYKEQLYAVIMGCACLEIAINQLIGVSAKVKKIQPSNVVKWAENMTISNKLKVLRFADLIDKKIYENLTLLFEIRNKFAHHLYLGAKSAKDEFEHLAKAHISDDFVKKLPNNSIKFQLMVSHCCVQLMEICKRLDPSSVETLELVSEMIPIEEYENNE